jgi:N-acetyl-alpha-D-glucosaminyl L-malate synthase BshA
MLQPEQQPRVVTTLHGTDTTLLGRDPGYGPAIHHALTQSDAVTAVSAYLKQESEAVLSYKGPIDVIHNFFEPGITTRSRSEVRQELGVGNEVLIIHSSNLRPAKRFDHLLETLARVEDKSSFKLLVLAGGSMAPFMDDIERLGLTNSLVIRQNVLEIEDYLQAADIALYTSESESFCLSILESMFFGCPSVATAVGGIPEVLTDGETGLLVPFGDVPKLAQAVERLIKDVPLRQKLGLAAKAAALSRFTAAGIVPQYEQLYRRLKASSYNPCAPSKT